MAPLADFCAYWFVCKRLGLEAEGRAPVDALLPQGLDRPGLAKSLDEAATDASMRVWPHVVSVDAAAILSACNAAQTIFDLRNGLLGAARLADETKEPADGFADYIVTRWLWRFVFKHDVRRRPIASKFPAHFDTQSRHLLLDALERTISSNGMRLDVASIREGIDKWKTLSDVRAAVLTKTTVA